MCRRWVSNASKGQRACELHVLGVGRCPFPWPAKLRSAFLTYIRLTAKPSIQELAPASQQGQQPETHPHSRAAGRVDHGGPRGADGHLGGRHIDVGGGGGALVVLVGSIVAGGGVDADTSGGGVDAHADFACVMQGVKERGNKQGRC